MADQSNHSDLVLRGINEADDTNIEITDDLDAMAHAEEAKAQPNYGLLKKLWCESALTVPKPENLAGCARASYGAFFSASNAQITKTEVAQLSLEYLRAGMEIAGTKTGLSEEFRAGIRKQAQCLFAIANKEPLARDCPVPYNK